MLCLTEPTDPAWVASALANLDAVLADHAHCELKAAANAMALAARAFAHPSIVRPLAELAEEELSHFRRVLVELERRGVALGPPPVDPYAATLRKLAASLAAGRAGPDAAMIDRLLVAALIEARSCERFRLLSDGLRAHGPADLAAFYEELLAAEARHFRTFHDLALVVAGGDAARVRARLRALAAVEGELVQGLDAEPTVHG